MPRCRNFTKVILLIISALTLSLLTTACQPADDPPASLEENTEDSRLQVAALKGPTGLGLLAMMEEQADLYQLSLQAAPDAVVPLLVSGQADVACIPANLASVLYHKTDGQVKVIGLNTLGVLYLVEKGDSIHDWSDLKGKTLISSGKGSVPEYLFRQVLQEHGLSDADLKLEYKADHSSVLAELSSGKADLAVLPQPFLTVALSKDENLRVVFDLSEESDLPVVMGVYAASARALADKKDQLRAFLQDAKASVDFVNSQPEEAGKLSEKHQVIAPAAIAAKAIPACSLVCITDLPSMQELLLPFLEGLHSFDPQTVGGSLVGTELLADLNK
ncbi:MAG: ABC transporter substrate-binding protein [Eubacteriales bacterium]|nr:ABC transporter substrate-binding protein [Eubacteriales bacterium]